MKQLIVLITMIILGVAIGGFVLNFSGQAKEIQQIGSKSISNLISGSAINK